MAQAGYTPISLYYSTTASAAPDASNLVAGELALNTNDEKLYFKNSAGTVKLLASVASTSNVSSISFGSTGLTPSTATTGAVTVAGTLAVGNGGTGITSFGTGVAGALGQNVSGSGSIALTTSPVFTTPNLGTPSAVTLTSATGLPLSTGITGTLAIGNGGTGSTSTTYCSLTTNVTGTLPVANGGTGVASATAYALLAGGTTTTGPFQSIASVGTAGQVLTSNGAGALPTFQAASGGVTTISFGSTGLTPSTATSGAVSVAGTLAVANGGTGATTITANSVILGNGTSNLGANLVAPGSSGNVLTSNGSTWTSAAASGGQLQTQVFYSPGTWTNPGSVTRVRVAIAGGGGGGANPPSGAPAGTAPSGGTSSFGPYISATGGGGGTRNNNGPVTPGAPGTGTVSSGTQLQGVSGISWSILSGSGSGAGAPSITAVAYGNSNIAAAGSGGNSGGGNGGAAWAIITIPTSPVTVTVGAGGNGMPGPGLPPSTGLGGVGGAVAVEFVG
jgi:hypothetical protein